jgi:hypothetical protein
MGKENRKVDRLAKLKQKVSGMSTEQLLELSASLRQRTRELSEQLKAINQQVEAEMQRRKKKRP